MLFKDLSLEGIKDGLRELRAQNIEKDQLIREKIKDFYEGRFVNHKYYKYGFFDKDNKPLIPLGGVNLTKKVVDKISLLYKQPPELGLEGDVADDPYIQWNAEHPEINVAKKTAECYKNLLHVILFAPLFFEREWTAFERVNKIAEWRFFIETDFIPHFHIDDPLHPFGYSIPVKQNPQNQGKQEDQRWMFWSDDYYFEHNNNGDIYAVDDTGFRNTFGVNPYIELRSSYPVDQYDTGGVYDLVQANHMINIAMADLNMMIHHQAFDQPTVSGIDGEQAKKLEVGPNKLLFAPEGSNFGLLGYSPKIAETIEAIKFQINTVAWTYNVSIDWSIEGTVASGVALKIKNMDLLEAREDDIDIAKSAEKKIYKAIQAQHTYYKKAKIIKDNFNLPDSPIRVNFAEIDFPANVDEEIKRKEFNLKYNIETPVDFIKDNDPDLSDEDAQKKYEDNKAINGNLTRADIFKQAAEPTNEQ